MGRSGFSRALCHPCDRLLGGTDGTDDGGHKAKSLGAATIGQGAGFEFAGQNVGLAGDGLNGLAESLLSEVELQGLWEGIPVNDHLRGIPVNAVLARGQAPQNGVRGRMEE